MTQQEFGNVVSIIRSVYQKDDFLTDPISLEVWYEMLKDLTFDQAKAAVQRHAYTNKWCPSIAELREQVVGIQSDKHDWADGWEEVLRAIRRFGYMNEGKALESMSEMTREVVKRLGWKQICQSEQSELTAIRANFRMIYEEKKGSLKEDAQLPMAFKEKLNQITGDGKKLLE